MTDEAPAVLGFAVLVIDCAEPAALARWWRRLLRGEVDVDADGDARLRVPGGPDIDGTLVPDPHAGVGRHVRMVHRG